MKQVAAPLPSVADKLLHTLERCEEDARHEIDECRLRLIARLIIWATQMPEHADYWAGELRRAEHAVDVQGGEG